jgi:hypothetical protein
MLDLSKLGLLKKDQPLDKNAVLNQYREMLEKLEHMSHEIEALKRDAAKEIQDVESTPFSKKKISRCHEFFVLAAEVCDTENYDVTKAYENLDEKMKKEFLPPVKFFKELKKYAAERGISVDTCVYPDQLRVDLLDFYFQKGHLRATTDMRESYEKCAQRILSHLHDKSEEEAAFKEIVDELERDFDELEDED